MILRSFPATLQDAGKLLHVLMPGDCVFNKKSGQLKHARCPKHASEVTTFRLHHDPDSIRHGPAYNIKQNDNLKQKKDDCLYD